MNLSVVSKIPRSLLSRSLRVLNWGLHHLEVSTLTESDGELPYPPIFIIGAPRSGSTLLYQVLTDYYDIGYLSNLHCQFYGAPSILERILHPLRWRQRSDYTSDRGLTKGWTAPSECGEFWYRFFRRKPQYVPLEEADPQKMRQLRNAAIALVTAFGKPVLFKNMNCALRLQPTAKALPEALFIVIHRDVVNNGHSLLQVRKNVWGNYTTWWSMEPLEIENLKKLPSHQQVIEQIRHIYVAIEKEKQTIGPDRFFDIQYENFCSNTYETLKKIEVFFSQHGVNLNKRMALSDIPASFEQSEKIGIDQTIYLELVNYANRK